MYSNERMMLIIIQSVTRPNKYIDKRDDDVHISEISSGFNAQRGLIILILYCYCYFLAVGQVCTVFQVDFIEK